ncbi:MAG: alpha/beta hydrolase family protein [Blastocatellia bacterium]
MRSNYKKLGWIALGIVVTLLIVLGFVLGPYALRVQRFPADPFAGHYADFYLYVSPAARRAASAGKQVTLLVQPNNSGVNSDDYEVHRKDAWWTGFGRRWLADELGVVLLVPAFLRPGEDWQIYTQALDRDVLTTARRDLARLDLQLLAMVDRARAALAAEGLPTDEKFLLQGYSASGMFANRFVALHPKRVKAVASGSPGGWPIAPVTHWGGEALPYPAGVADLEELTGQPFDRLAYQAVPQLIVMGSLDDNDSLDFRDGWDKQPAALVDRLFGADPLSRWRQAEMLYQAAGADARFVLVEGVGHDRKKLQEHTTRFFASLLGR